MQVSNLCLGAKWLLHTRRDIRNLRLGHRARVRLHQGPEEHAQSDQRVLSVHVGAFGSNWILACGVVDESAACVELWGCCDD